MLLLKFADVAFDRRICLQRQLYPPTTRSACSTNCALHGLNTETTNILTKTEAQEVGKVGFLQTEGQINSRAPPVPALNQQDAISQSLLLLEWPALSRQVACFCSTAVTAERFLEDGLPLGQTEAESEALLQETCEAGELEFELAAVSDLRPLLAAVQAGRVLHPIHLAAVAATIDAAQSLQDCLAVAQNAVQLRARGPHVEQPLRDLREEIWRCVHPRNGSILDTASPLLNETRAQRRDNFKLLRETLETWARRLHASGVSERPQVVNRRDRLCVAVRAGRQGELPRGSIVLATSSTGATLYMEPAPAVPLNNNEAVLAAAEQQEEAAISLSLCRAIAHQAPALLEVLDEVAVVDAAKARAAHGAWLRANRPQFLSPEQATAEGSFRATSARHPLLLERSLPALRPPPAPSEVSFDALSPADRYGPASSQQSPREDGEERREAVAAPRAIDLVVPPGVRVVTVTGPNTGGKTAALKTMGLLALMARAGLFLPAQQPRLAFFSRVLADIGDGQSLQQSLSTFSGHVRRLRSILHAATPDSLVLLDEVGSGTDPTEGAALAGAILERLADQACLTFATTHHAELKDMPGRDNRFENASVEFDMASLAPTYRLMWGLAGESNALAVARGLGFDPLVVDEAERLVRESPFSLRNASSRAAALRESLEDELEAAREALQDAKARRQGKEEEVQALETELDMLKEKAKTQSKAQPTASSDALVAGVERLLVELASGAILPDQAQARLLELREGAPDSVMPATTLYGLKAGGTGILGVGMVPDEDGAAWVPSAGDTVQVLKMGGAPGKVVQAPARPGDKISVKVGNIVLKVEASGVLRAPQSPANQGKPKAAAASKQLLVDAIPSPDAYRGDAAAAAEIQFASNTVDVRNCNVEEALAELDEHLAEAPPRSVLFVVHGIGSGQLRAAVRSFLGRHPEVQTWKDDPKSAGGCTIAVLR